MKILAKATLVICAFSVSLSQNARFNQQSMHEVALMPRRVLLGRRQIQQTFPIAIGFDRSKQSVR